MSIVYFTRSLYQNKPLQREIVLIFQVESVYFSTMNDWLDKIIILFNTISYKYIVLAWVMMFVKSRYTDW